MSLECDEGDKCGIPIILVCVKYYIMIYCLRVVLIYICVKCENECDVHGVTEPPINEMI